MVSLSQDKVAIKNVERDVYYDYHTYQPFVEKTLILENTFLVSLSQDKVAIKTMERDDYYDYHTYRPYTTDCLFAVSLFPNLAASV